MPFGRKDKFFSNASNAAFKNEYISMRVRMSVQLERGDFYSHRVDRLPEILGIRKCSVKFRE